LENRVTAARKIRAKEPTENAPQSLAAVVKAAGIDVSHNLNGQKLGRKGRGTRERILAATAELLEGPEDEAITMSAVARKASLGMTSLYNYFTDFTELLLAVLEPVIAEGEHAFMGMLRERWPDEELGERCYAFMRAYHGFWARNSRLLHLRNAMADNRDERMLIQRVRATQPVIALLAAQMDDDHDDRKRLSRGMATVLMTGIERTVTVATDRRLTGLFGPDRRQEPDHYLRPEARLMELAIRDTRDRLAAERSAKG
jgi:AcrR family transcriptional regulator